MRSQGQSMCPHTVFLCSTLKMCGGRRGHPAHRLSLSHVPSISFYWFNLFLGLIHFVQSVSCAWNEKSERVALSGGCCR